jgi:hypothetical protein
MVEISTKFKIIFRIEESQTVMFKKIFLLLLLAHSLVAQVAKVDSGQLNGARYRILFPPNWKGKLVMYAHGYEFMGTKPLQSQNPEFINRMSPFLSRGFAVVV